VYPYIWYSRATAHESTSIIWYIYVRTVLLLPVQLLCTVHKVLYISRDPVTRYPVIYASTCTRTVQCVATYVGMCIYSAISARAHESMYSTTYHMLCTVDTYCIYSVYVLYREYIYVCIPWIMGPNTDIHATTIYSTCVRTLKEYSTSYLCTYMGRYAVSIYHVFQCYAHEEHGWSTHDVPYGVPIYWGYVLSRCYPLDMGVCRYHVFQCYAHEEHVSHYPPSTAYSTCST